MREWTELKTSRRSRQGSGEKEDKIMPVLSKFYGIVIRMVGTSALNARFHAFYGDYELVIEIAPLRIIDGEAPERVRGLVMEWARAHQRELLEAWNHCRRAERPAPIEPLA